eukprot:TRINITY_DN10972_c0_g1_i1.p2 TRINITY_DN10972_c0_g1~~TRINITY_DN10972_c0_g1_i1.p2  ORF type:complete len:189 (+),score=-7.34 TRINITY_DN10972_c0_g1_i1:185-751(+)
MLYMFKSNPKILSLLRSHYFNLKLSEFFFCEIYQLFRKDSLYSQQIHVQMLVVVMVFRPWQIVLLQQSNKVCKCSQKSICLLTSEKWLFKGMNDIDLQHFESFVYCRKVSLYNIFTIQVPMGYQVKPFLKYPPEWIIVRQYTGRNFGLKKKSFGKTQQFKQKIVLQWQKPQLGNIADNINNLIQLQKY